MSMSRIYPVEKPLDGLESFYGEFLTSREGEYKELKTALTRNDYTAIAEAAHRWKGFCEPYGFGQLGKIASELEVKAKESNKAGCESLLADVGHYLAHKRAQA